MKRLFLWDKWPYSRWIEIRNDTDVTIEEVRDSIRKRGYCTCLVKG